MKSQSHTIKMEYTKPFIALNVPGIRLAAQTSAFNSQLHRNIALSSFASFLFTTYVAFMLVWNILPFIFALCAQATSFAFIAYYTFTVLKVLSTNSITSPDQTPESGRKISAVTEAPPSLPLLCINKCSAMISFTSTPTNKSDDTTANKRKESHILARRRVRDLLINIVPGDVRRRVDMNLNKANIRVGKAFLQVVPGQRKGRDIYVMRVDCSAESATQKKHMNPVIMWDVTATFDEFKQFEHQLKKEVKAKKCGRKVHVPHLSSGAVFFVQPELTDHVLNVRRKRLQTFMDDVRSDPVLSTMACLRTFCQAY